MAALQLRTDIFVVLKEVSRKCVFDRSSNFPAQLSDQMFGVIVNNLVDNHRLYFGTARYAKSSDIGLNEVTDIWIVSVLFSISPSLESVWPWNWATASAFAIFSSNSISQAARCSVFVARSSWIVYFRHLF